MNEHERPNGEPAGDRERKSDPAIANADPGAGRADRDPAEGPGLGGGSALTADEPAADEEVGGGE